MNPATDRANLHAFVTELAFDDLPRDVVAQAQRCLLDLIGVAAAGSRTPLAHIVVRHAATQLASVERGARILFDGRVASAAGAAFAGASTIDAFDAHDGHVLTKGHAGVAVLPALLAYVDAGMGPSMQGRELITALVVGYEVATRAGISLHSSVADYHCSGAWNALAAAAVGCRLLRLDQRQMQHALGIAEYLGPRGQMLRVCASPTMLKDGSGWGAHAGVTAALLAQDGFTGAPALTTMRGEGPPLWDDLRERWRICEQYFKPYPVCRWAQPAIEAALALRSTHAFDTDGIAGITVETFREAIVLAAESGYPRTTEEAQYSLAYPIAAALALGRLGAEEVSPSMFDDARLKRLASLVRMTDDAAFSRAFPAQRWARLRIALSDGRSIESEPAFARGGAESPLSDDMLRAKYHALADPIVGLERALFIAQRVDELAAESAALPSLL
ncbi:MAG: MmgE/PrpD family protein, partial [Pseudomonadota bacterium]|nr:MmgE/PrpD family protein [Pseudomonadota bacterium]